VLLGIEAGVFLYAGATWIVPHVLLAVIAAGLLIPHQPRWLRIAITMIASIYAVGFVFPGSLWMALGACGITSAGCPQSFWVGVSAFAVGAAVNVVAAFLLLRRLAPGKSPETSGHCCRGKDSGSQT
jgi:hypothetical protein